MGHHHHEEVTGKALGFTVFLNILITVVEIIGGIISGSLSLLSDALHNFSDAISLIISYIALKMSKRPRTGKYTFGLKRVEIIAAVFNASVLIAISILLIKEAYHKFYFPNKVSGELMAGIALIGLAANIIGTLLLKKGAKSNINIRSSYLHLLSDAFSSFAVIIGGVSIYYYEYYWVDPLLTVLISLYILKESYELVKQSVSILILASPKEIEVEHIKETIEKIKEVINLHHVHIYHFSEDEIHFQGHIEVSENMRICDATALSRKIEHILHEEFGVEHATLQFESNKCDNTSLI